MGVNIRIYGVFGIKVSEFDTDLCEKYHNLEDNNMLPDILKDCLFDGMCGEYMMFGIQMYKSNDFRYDDETPPTSFSHDDLLHLRLLEEEFKEVFCKIFPEAEAYMNHEFKLEIFTHYT